MRILPIVLAGLAAVAGVAHADQRADLQAKGEQLAKDGRYGEAIESFKAADRLEPRASHACLIALAYSRRELWPQAQLFLAMCHERAKAGDALPDWAPLADKQIKERLAAARVVEVAIEVTPPQTPATVTVSSFAPDEVFAPRTIYLPPGRHVIFARAEGHPDRQQTIEIADTMPKRVVFEYEPLAAPAPTPAPAIELGATVTPAEEPPTSTLPNRLMIAGGATVVAGGVAHVAMALYRRKLVDARDRNDQPAYDESVGGFRKTRVLSIAAYSVGAGLLVTGYLLRRNAKREAAQLSAAPLPEGGALVTLGWSR